MLWVELHELEVSCWSVAVAMRSSAGRPWTALLTFGWLLVWPAFFGVFLLSQAFCRGVHTCWALSASRPRSWAGSRQRHCSFSTPSRGSPFTCTTSAALTCTFLSPLLVFGCFSSFMEERKQWSHCVFSLPYPSHSPFPRSYGLRAPRSVTIRQTIPEGAEVGKDGPVEVAELTVDIAQYCPDYVAATTKSTDKCVPHTNSGNDLFCAGVVCSVSKGLHTRLRYCACRVLRVCEIGELLLHFSLRFFVSVAHVT